MALLLITLVALIWCSDFIYTNTIQLVTPNNSLSKHLTHYFNQHVAISNTLSILLTGINALLLGQLNNNYTIIRTRSFLPMLFYILLMACWHQTHTLVLSHLVLSFVILAIFVIFNAYRNRLATEQAFLSSLLIAVSSLFFEPLIFYIPLIWVGLFLFHSFSIRTLLASIIGAFTPWLLFMVVCAYYQPDLLWFNQLGASFEIGLSVSTLPLATIIYMSALAVLFLIGLVGLISNMNQDSMQTRSMLVFIIYYSSISFILSMIYAKHFYNFLPFVALGIPIVLAHPITLKKGNFYAIIFYIFILLNLTYVVSNIILST
jgi:hypothetical protein